MKALRINRFLSQAGLGSRRQVEELVREGRVRLNGETVRDLATQVDPAADRVEFDGRVLKLPESNHTYIYHKPVGVVSSLSQQGDAPSLREVLPDELFEGRLFHVGRLDADSSGLLLLSDDGELGQALLHPSRPVWKVYQVETTDELGEDELRRFREGGIPVDGRLSAPARIEARAQGPRRYTIELREGRNRQIRRMIESLGSRVLQLHRVSFGPLELGELRPGEWRELDPEEVQRLREAASAGD